MVSCGTSLIGQRASSQPTSQPTSTSTSEPRFVASPSVLPDWRCLQFLNKERRNWSTTKTAFFADHCLRSARRRCAHFSSMPIRTLFRPSGRSSPCRSTIPLQSSPSQALLLQPPQPTMRPALVRAALLAANAVEALVATRGHDSPLTALVPARTHPPHTFPILTRTPPPDLSSHTRRSYQKLHSHTRKQR